MQQVVQRFIPFPFLKIQGPKSAGQRAQLIEIQLLLSKICDRFFIPLAELFASGAENSQLKNSAQQELRDSFNEFLIELTQRQIQDAQKPVIISFSGPEGILQAHIESTITGFFSSFSVRLSALFQADQPVLLEVKEDLEALYRVAALVICAVQQTILSVPRRLFSGEESVPEPITDKLVKALQQIEDIRQAYALPAPLRNLAEVLRELYLQLARADGYVWLPFKPLISSPLLEEDLLFYVSNRTGREEQLARQMVTNDGVILVTGYRGTGKSTFINAALAKLKHPEFRHQQMVHEDWRVIPIQVNLASAEGIPAIRRLCIRALYTTLLKEPVEKDIPALLTDEEKRHLYWSNLRASYKVNLQQSDSVATLKQIQATLDLKLGDLLPKNSGILGLPLFGMKASKEWNKKLERTIDLLDYDEDQAEQDIAHLIKKLAGQPPPKRKVRIKLVFIFDEMDKLDVKDLQIPMIEKLKNLFLTRHAVFLLVTSKEFYYYWLEERKKEDAPLSSYFSSVVMVPLFTTEETVRFLDQLIWTTPQHNEEEREFVRAFARYVTYQSHGIPRDIIRQLQDQLQWLASLAQPYIRNQTEHDNQIRIYAEIQQTLENLAERVTDQTKLPTGAIQASSSAAVTLAPEWLWMDEGRREQMKRGLYILVEEFINQQRLTISDKPKVLDEIRLEHFTLLEDVPDIFWFLVNELARRLQDISASDDRTKEAPATPRTLFSLNSAGEFVVAEEFYTLTGRRPRSIDQNKGVGLTPEQIAHLLTRPALFHRLHGLARAQQFAEKSNGRLPAVLAQGLYHKFISPEEALDFRLQSARLLEGPDFFTAAGEELPDQFIDQETDESLLKEFVRLVKSGTRERHARQTGIAMLLRLLNRQYQVAALQKPTAALPLPESAVSDALISLRDLARHEELEAIVLREPTQAVTWIGMLISLNFRALSPSILAKIDDEQQALLWSQLINNKDAGLAQKFIVELLKQLAQQASSSNATALRQTSSLFRQFILWLDSPSFRSADVALLQEGFGKESVFLKELREQLPESSRAHQNIDRALGLAPAAGETAVQAAVNGTPLQVSGPQKTGPKKRANRSLVMYSALFWSVVYYIVPFDLPSNIDPIERLLARTIAAGFWCCAVGGLLFLLTGIILSFTKDWVTAIIEFGVSVFGIVIAVVFFFAYISWLSLKPTLVGELEVVGMLALIPSVSGIVWALTRKPIPETPEKPAVVA